MRVHRMVNARCWILDRGGRTGFRFSRERPTCDARKGKNPLECKGLKIRFVGKISAGWKRPETGKSGTIEKGLQARYLQPFSFSRKTDGRLRWCRSWRAILRRGGQHNPLPKYVQIKLIHTPIPVEVGTRVIAGLAFTGIHCGQ